MSIMIFLYKEEKLHLTNTRNKHVVLFASRHPPPANSDSGDCRLSHARTCITTRDTLPCNKSQPAYVFLCMYSILLSIVHTLLLQVPTQENMRTLPCRLGCPGAPSPAETTLSCLFGEVVMIAWFHLSIFNTKRAGHVACRHEELRTTEG